jgi:SAM-dependent methyltransferase
MKDLLKRVGRIVLWPLRRFFDPRFHGLATAIESDVRVTLEATDLLGRSLAETTSLVERTLAEAEKASGTYFERLREGNPAVLDDKAATLFNHEAGSVGLAAQSGLWFNPPVSIRYESGAVVMGSVNERAAEIPYVFRGLAGLGPGARVLDVGATESTVALSLASLGYEVTAIDPRPYPLSHPRLRAVVGTIEDWAADGTFDAVVCLSTIEHIGLGAYGVERDADSDADRAAMKRLLELTAPAGRLLLTTRFGRAAVGELERTYDRAGLDALLEGWEVEDVTFVQRTDEQTWEVSDPSEEAGAELVAMVTATRPA